VDAPAAKHHDGLSPTRRLAAFPALGAFVSRISFLSLALVLVTHAASGQQTGCLLASQRPMIVAEMFFGRSISGRRPVSEGEWSSFVARVVASQFPGGFTVHDGAGEWRDPATRKVVREHTKILTVAFNPSINAGPKLGAVIQAYKRQFHQTSVGIITADACGAF